MGDEVVVEVDPQPEGEGSDDVTVNEGDTTVIVEPEVQDEEHSEELAVTVGRLSAEVAEMRRRLESTEDEVEVTQAVLSVTAETAAEAIETAEGAGEFAEEVADVAANPGDEDEVADIAEPEDTKDGILPTKKHWVHRSFREWVGGDQ